MIMVVWPAVLKLEGDDELTFVPNRETWDREGFTEDLELKDRLIDSRGSVFRFSCNEEREQIESTELSETISLANFEQLVKQHLVCLEQCCVSKIQLSSFLQGFQLLKQHDSDI